jgi:hypothetical protein
MSAMAEVHRAIFTRLSNDAPLAAAGFDVFDEPPDSRTASYIVIGDGTEANGPGSHSTRAWEGTETLHIWSRGNSTVRAREALELVRAAMETTRLNVAGHSTMWCRLEFSMVMKEPGWRHIPARFRIVTGSALPATEW